MNQFELPKEAKHYLLLQRPYYQSGASTAKKIFDTLSLQDIYVKYFLPLFDDNSLEELSDRYYAEITDEYDTIRGFLPSSPGNILDIGCGLGGIDVLLDAHYSQEPNFYLLDKDDISELYYGYREDPAVYNSFDATEKFLHRNGIDPGRLHTIDVNSDEYPHEAKFGLIISLFSWGFHYPLDTYIQEVKETLEGDGVVIVDIREGTDGREILENEFESVRVISKRRNHRVPKDRLCARLSD